MRVEDEIVQLRKRVTTLQAALHARDLKLAKRRAQVRQIHGHIKATPGHPFLRWMAEAEKRRTVEEAMVQYLIGIGHDACLPEYEVIDPETYGPCSFCKVLTPYNLARVYIARHGLKNYHGTQHAKFQGVVPRDDTVSTEQG